VSTHPDLAPEAVEALRDSLGIGAPPTNGAGGETEASTGVHVTAPSARMPLKARLRAGVRNRVRAATAPVLDRLAGRLVERVRHSVRMDLRVEYGQFESELQMLRATVDAVVPAQASPSARSW
jgi:hypothetical protein